MAVGAAIALAFTLVIIVVMGRPLRSLPGGAVSDEGAYEWGPFSTNEFNLGGFWVEYNVEGVNQIQVNHQVGLSFAAGLRSILRHDPDIIMIGEIRDLETAEAAVQASLTGHLVFSTLHTNDAAGAMTRLLDMGVEPFLVASSVEGVLAQRLVRRVCQGCGRPHEPAREYVTSAGAFLS